MNVIQSLAAPAIALVPNVLTMPFLWTRLVRPRVGFCCWASQSPLQFCLGLATDPSSPVGYLVNVIQSLAAPAIALVPNVLAMPFLWTRLVRPREGFCCWASQSPLQFCLGLATDPSSPVGYLVNVIQSLAALAIALVPYVLAMPFLWTRLVRPREGFCCWASQSPLQFCLGLATDPSSIYRRILGKWTRKGGKEGVSYFSFPWPLALRAHHQSLSLHACPRL